MISKYQTKNFAINRYLLRNLKSILLFVYVHVFVRVCECGVVCCCCCCFTRMSIHSGGSALVVFSYQEKMTSLSCSYLNRLQSQQCLRTTTDWQFSPFALFLYHFLFLYFDFEDYRTLIILMPERSKRENTQIFMDHVFIRVTADINKLKSRQ